MKEERRIVKYVDKCQNISPPPIEVEKITDMDGNVLWEKGEEPALKAKCPWISFMNLLKLFAKRLAN